MTGNKLKKWREKLALTQADVAAEFDVSLSTIARWEQGKEKEIRNPLIDFAVTVVNTKLARNGTAQIKHYEDHSNR